MQGFSHTLLFLPMHAVWKTNEQKVNTYLIHFTGEFRWQGVDTMAGWGGWKDNAEQSLARQLQTAFIIRPRQLGE